MPYFTYILTTHTRMFYVGMTDDIHRRTFEHKTGFYEGGFTDRYRVDQLVCYEERADAVAAAAREKQLKGWTRAKKIALIERTNEHWIDLADRWFTEVELQSESLTPGAFNQSDASPRFRPDPSTTAGTPALRTFK
jgi:putative endonuclease